MEIGIVIIAVCVIVIAGLFTRLIHNEKINSMTDKVQKIKDWISKEQDGLMDAQGNFEYPEHEGAYHILCNLDAYIDSLQEEPISKDTKESVLYNDMKSWEVPEYIIEAINKKRVCPTFKGEALHKFKNEFNTLKQTLHLLYNLDTSVNYRLALHWASWGAQNLQGCFGVSEEEKAKMDIEEPVSIWHGMSEEAENGRNIIIIDPKDFYGAVLRKGGSQLRNHNKERYVKWAYIDDIIKLSNVERTVKNWREPVSDDLEKASTKYAQDKYMPVQTSQAFKAGANWQKEQMMKNAVDGWVFRDIKEGKLRISDNKECWNGIRIPEKSIEKSYLFCTSDDAIKVKLVIVKED